ncbi:hypothetical protein FPCIR_12710 [Fusarium pseudocircinatum]|uniref:Uncharacterized protein n=1 Tax=Fusarium pseudocircinatum TaxID=56676 RepID=A0A8H5KMZ7_9HYPO|nr:hypothetical protein FPCIR_12710 [Fusarium pseudocircinatum]
MILPNNTPNTNLLEFLQKDVASDPISDLVSQRQTPRDWLKKLTTVDFTDPASILNLRFDLVEYNVGEFILCTNSKNTFSISPEPAPLSVDYTAIQKDSDVHPGLMALEFVDSSDDPSGSEHGGTAKSSGVDQPLPSLVLPIGQLLKGYTAESGIKDSDETNYVLVVDAVASAHPVWLVFDRTAEDVLKEGEDDDNNDNDNGDGDDGEEGEIHPDTAELVFDRTEKNFDAALVLPSIQDWFQSYENLSLTQILDSFRKTGLTGKVKAREVTAEDASLLWNKDSSVDKNK